VHRHTARLVLGALVLVVGCHQGNNVIIVNSGAGLSGGGGAPGQALIGPAGGTVRGSGSLAGVSVTFPPGALAADTLIRLEPGSPVSTVRSLQVGNAFHVDAGGAQLASSATVTIPYDQLALYGSYEGASEDQLWVLKKEDASGDTAWVVPSSIDPVNQLVSVQVTNFSTFAGATAQPARYVYVSNFGDGTSENIGDNTISFYSVNNNTGRLRCVGYQYVGSTSAGPSPVTVNPADTRVWVANFDTNTIIGYTIETNGFLTLFSNTLSAPGGPVAFAITPDSTWAYTADFSNNTTTAYSTGGTIAHYAAGTDPEWIAMVPSAINGTYFDYVPAFNSNNVLAYQINDGNGQLTNIQTVAAAANSNPIAAVVDPSAHYLYVAEWTTGVVNAYSIAQSGGTVGQLSLIAGGSTSPNASVVNPIALTTDIFGSFVITCNFTSNNVSSYTIAANGGLSSSPTSTAAAGTGPNAIQRDPAGNYVFMVNQSSNEVLSFGLTRAGVSGAGTLTPGVKVRTQTLPTGISVSAGNAGVTYTSTHLYAPTANNSSVNAYNVGGTGQLSASNPATYSIGSGSTNPLTVATDPQFKYIYFARSDGTVFAYSINAGNGQLTSIGNTSVTTTGVLAGITCEPSDRFAYVLERTTSASATSPGAIAVCTIGNNGALTVAATVASVGTASAQSITVDPTGRFLYVADDGTNTSPARQESVLCYGINSATGGLTFMNQTFTGGHSNAPSNNVFPLRVAVDSTGRFLYIPNMLENSVSEFSIDNTAGTLTSIGTITPTGANALNAPAGIAANPAMDALYVVNSGAANGSANEVSSFSINSGTGVLTFLSGVTADNGPIGISCDISGGYAYVSDRSSGRISMYTVQANGSLATNGGTVNAGGQTNEIVVVGTVQ
jgi:6-phosphogluconolactonase (cycloisomerase 2 family)